MKKFLVAFCLIGSVLLILLFTAVPKGEENGYLRVHIRADSNAPEAQAVKYEVRDAVVAFLTPIVAFCETKEEAMEKIGGLLPEISSVAEEVLEEKGFSYGARASLKRETFPTRVYENVTLEAGVYDALILELGSGKGDNWWCVVYPPLCFAGGNASVVYKSKIAEIVRRFFAD